MKSTCWCSRRVMAAWVTVGLLFGDVSAVKAAEKRGQSNDASTKKSEKASKVSKLNRVKPVMELGLTGSHKGETDLEFTFGVQIPLKTALDMSVLGRVKTLTRNGEALLFSADIANREVGLGWSWTAGLSIVLTWLTAKKISKRMEGIHDDNVAEGYKACEHACSEKSDSAFCKTRKKKIGVRQKSQLQDWIKVKANETAIRSVACNKNKGKVGKLVRDLNWGRLDLEELLKELKSIFDECEKDAKSRIHALVSQLRDKESSRTVLRTARNSLCMITQSQSGTAAGQTKKVCAQFPERIRALTKEISDLQKKVAKAEKESGEEDKGMTEVKKRLTKIPRTAYPSSFNVDDLCDHGKSIYRAGVTAKLLNEYYFTRKYPPFYLSVGLEFSRKESTFTASESDDSTDFSEHKSAKWPFKVGMSFAYVPAALPLTLEGIGIFKWDWQTSSDEIEWCQPAGVIVDPDEPGVAIPAQQCDKAALGRPAKYREVYTSLMLGVRSTAGVWRFSAGPHYGFRFFDDWADNHVHSYGVNLMAYAAPKAGKTALWGLKGMLRLQASLQWTTIKTAGKKSEGFAFVLAVSLLGQRTMFSNAFDQL